MEHLALGEQILYILNKNRMQIQYVQNYTHYQKAYEEIFKKEVGFSVLLGFLKRSNRSELEAPSFAQPKPKSNSGSFLST